MAEMIIESPDEVVAFLKAQHNLIENMFDIEDMFDKCCTRRIPERARSRSRNCASC